MSQSVPFLCPIPVRGWTCRAWHQALAGSLTQSHWWEADLVDGSMAHLHPASLADLDSLRISISPLQACTQLPASHASQPHTHPGLNLRVNHKGPYTRKPTQTPEILREGPTSISAYGWSGSTWAPSGTRNFISLPGEMAVSVEGSLSLASRQVRESMARRVPCASSSLCTTCACPSTCTQQSSLTVSQLPSALARPHDKLGLFFQHWVGKLSGIRVWGPPRMRLPIHLRPQAEAFVSVLGTSVTSKTAQHNLPWLKRLQALQGLGSCVFLGVGVQQGACTTCACPSTCTQAEVSTGLVNVNAGCSLLSTSTVDLPYSDKLQALQGSGGVRV